VVVTFTLSLIGLGVAIFLTIAHYTSTSILACSSTGTIDCAAVTTSAQSVILGVPVAVLGVVNFVAMVVLNSPWAWFAKSPLVHKARIVLVGVSMAFVLWLVYAELIIINHICLYCTSVHVITFALFIIVCLMNPIRINGIRGFVSEGGEASVDEVSLQNR
jgi:uncharacterized membrane protein